MKRFRPNFSANNSGFFLLIIALLVGGVSAQSAGLLNTPDSVCDGCDS